MSADSYQCQYCQGTQSTVACDDIRDWEYGVPGSYAYYRCRDCQGVQLHPFPDLDDLKQAYDIDYHGYAAGGKRGLLFSLLYSVKESLFRNKMRSLVDENAKILDVGCGAGDFLLNMRKLKVRRLQGIDFSADMINHLQAQGIEGFCGTFTDFQGEPGSYDLISMNNYLEHTLSPGDELRKALDLLGPDAHLVGEVPGFGSWDQKLFGRFWGGNHVPRHTYQFTPGLLKRLLEDAGFTQVKVSHQLNTSHWALSVQNFLQRKAPNLRNNPAIENGRSNLYVPLLLLFIPVNLVCVLAKKSGCIKFTARKPTLGPTSGGVYDEQSYSAGYPAGIEQHFWHRARNDFIYRWLKSRLKHGELVMDVGCGTGLVVADLRSRGIDAQGVEQGAAPVFPGMELHVETGCDLFDLAPERKVQINAILLLDVIEHMVDRRQFLMRIGRDFPNCRMLLVTVPARMELWTGFDEYWGHHLRYNRPELRAELAAAGFAPLRTSYFFNWLYLASLAMKLLRFPKGTQFSPIRRGSGSALLHRALGWLTRIENRMVPGSIAGSSLACIAQRVDK